MQNKFEGMLQRSQSYKHMNRWRVSGFWLNNCTLHRTNQLYPKLFFCAHRLQHFDLFISRKALVGIFVTAKDGDLSFFVKMNAPAITFG